HRTSGTVVTCCIAIFETLPQATVSIMPPKATQFSQDLSTQHPNFAALDVPAGSHKTRRRRLVELQNAIAHHITLLSPFLGLASFSQLAKDGRPRTEINLVFPLGFRQQNLFQDLSSPKPGVVDD